MGELIREALCRFEEHGQLTNAIMSGQDRLDALDDFLTENVNRITKGIGWRGLVQQNRRQANRCKTAKSRPSGGGNRAGQPGTGRRNSRRAPLLPYNQAFPTGSAGVQFCQQ